MTAKEREIAVAALELNAPTYPELLQKIFERTKVKSDEVQITLDKLCKELPMGRSTSEKHRCGRSADTPANTPVRERS
jgi:hypothetical protein